MLTLQEMEVFLMVIECGSFSKAAQPLNMSQPTVSQTVQNLEARMQTPLFERHRRGVFLTDAGEALLPMAQELMTTARRLEASMAELHGMVVGKLKIGCSTSAGKYLIPRLIADFRRNFDQVRLDVLIRSRISVFERLISGQVDFGVSSKIIEHHDLEYVPFFEDEVVLVVAANHPWAKFGKVFPDDLLDAPIILREPDSGTNRGLFEGLREYDITPDMLNVVMELGNAEAITMAVEAEIGAAFVSRLVARRSVEAGYLAIVEVEGMTLQHHIHIARNHRIPMSRAQSEFWEFMLNHRDILRQMWEGLAVQD